MSPRRTDRTDSSARGRPGSSTTPAAPSSAASQAVAATVDHAERAAPADAGEASGDAPAAAYAAGGAVAGLPVRTRSGPVTGDAGRAVRLALASTGTEARLLTAARRSVGLFVRTSTLEQADDATRGSPSAQLEAGYEDAERLGVGRQDVILVDAFGEAGTRKAKRHQFNRLRALIRAGAVGVVIVPEHHRLSRNAADAEALFNEAADARVLLLINGQAFDPNVPHERYMLGMLAQFAQYENDARTRWLLRSKLARARQLRARFPLPTGLVWASRTDTTYLAAVEATRDPDLLAWLEAARANRAASPAATTTFEILPYPDPAVLASVRCRLEWLLETGSLDAVVGRIKAGHAGWPKGQKGKVPVPMGSSVYRAGTRVRWEAVKAKAVYDLAVSPSLYGIYSFYMESLSAVRPVKSARRPKGSHYAAARAREWPPLPDARALMTAPTAPTRPAEHAAEHPA